MKWFWGVVIVAVAGAIGVGFAVYKLRCQISYGLDFGSVIDAIALLVVGALIEFVYSQRSSDKRADTDLLLGIVSEARVLLGELEKAAQCYETGHELTAEEQHVVTGSTRQLSNAIHSVQIGLQHCKVVLDSVEFEKLKDALFELDDALTNEPFPGPYDHGCVNRIHVASRATRDELTRVAFALNRR